MLLLGTFSEKRKKKCYFLEGLILALSEVGGNNKFMYFQFLTHPKICLLRISRIVFFFFFFFFCVCVC